MRLNCSYFYFCYCCCCISLSIETLIKLEFYLTLFTNIYILSPLQKEKEINDCFLSLVDLFFKYLLFVSIKKNKSNYARYTLFYYEIMFLYQILTIKKSINRCNKRMAKYLNKVCGKKDQEEECMISIIILYLVKILNATSFVSTFYSIYRTYYALAFIKLKTLKKLQ